MPTTSPITKRSKVIKGPPRFDIKKVAKAIDWPVQKWKGNCHAVACSLVEHGIVKGEAVYGHYTGFIHAKSMFAVKAKLGFCQHGWVLTTDGWIVDPTRWVFENKEPYIFVARAPHLEYDEGANHFRRLTMVEPPGFDPNTPEDKIVTLDFSEFEESEECCEKVWELLKRRDNGCYGISCAVSMQEMHWLANVAYELFFDRVNGMDLAPNIFKIIADLGYKAHVPIDNYRRAERHGKQFDIELP